MATPDKKKVEAQKNNPSGSSAHLVEITPAQRAALEHHLPELKRDFADFKKNFKNFENDHQEFWKKHANNAKIAGLMATIDSLLDQIDKNKNTVKDAYILQAIDEYNLHIQTLNRLIIQVDSDILEKTDKTLGAAMRGELPLEATPFTEADKKELREFMNALWEELFPQSNVEKFLLSATGRTKSVQIDTYERYLIAPAEGIEAAVVGLLNLINPKSYRDFDDAVNRSYGMNYNQICAVLRSLKFVHSQMDTSREITAVISLLYSIIFLFGGTKILKASKVLNSASNLSVGPKVKAFIDTVIFARTATYQGGHIAKLLPVGAMIGLSLKTLQINEVS